MDARSMFCISILLAWTENFRQRWILFVPAGMVSPFKTNVFTSYSPVRDLFRLDSRIVSPTFIWARSTGTIKYK